MRAGGYFSRVTASSGHCMSPCLAETPHSYVGGGENGTQSL